MNTTDDSTTDDSSRGDTAAGRAEAGTAAWEDAVRLQRWATPDHADFYALAPEIVATLHALEDLARVLRRQVAGYVAGQQVRGRAVYDDTRQHDPRRRLAEAATDLDILADRLLSAERAVNTFWSAIGHIGTEDATEDRLEQGPGDCAAPSDCGEATR
jgi:hypothetical protein